MKIMFSGDKMFINGTCVKEYSKYLRHSKQRAIDFKLNGKQFNSAVIDEQIADETYIDDLEEPISSCCHVPTYDKNNRQFCSSCRKQCNLVVTCQKCKGRGEYLGESGGMTGCDCDNGYIYLEDL